MDIAAYQVALKILLKRGDEYLLLKDAITGKIDLPGGRINENECEIQLADIIRREVDEEAGSELKFKLGKPAYQYRARFKNGGPRVFIVVFEADYISGVVNLSSEHSDYRWVKIKDMNFNEGDFFNKEAYMVFKHYFGNLGN